MSIIVYGIKNCNTVKSALEWLTDHHIDFQFHDYKSKGIDGSTLKKWCGEVGWESMVNKRGTTWRQLPADVQGRVKDQASAISLMKEKTSVIKRPLVESGGKIVALGFDPVTYEKIFKA